MADIQYFIKRNSTSQIIEVFAASGTGKGQTGIVFSDVTIRLFALGEAGAAIVGAPIAGATAVDVYESNKWQEVDAVNMPGLYQYSAPDGVYSLNTPSAIASFKFTSASIQDTAVQIYITKTSLQDGVKLSADGWDDIPCETSNPRIALEALMAVMGGELTGAGTGTISIKAWLNNAITRLVVDGDSEGNRNNFNWILNT